MVNKRLLLNHASSPSEHGELYLSVKGPAGYGNLVRYHIRAGYPEPKHFGLLAPGESVSQKYPLLDYESFHVPGTYVVWVTYRNTVKTSVKGISVFVGSIASQTVSIRRYDNGDDRSNLAGADGIR